ncbi:MAG: DUF5930 domain-containing protein [Pseudomonadota bacterium]
MGQARQMNERTIGLRQRILSKIVPERRIYVRSDCATRYFTVGPASQIGLAMLTIGLVGWSAFTSVAFVSQASDARQAEIQLETMREAYEARLAASEAEQRHLEMKIESADARGDLIGQRLSEKQRLLVEIANQLQEANLELGTLRDEYKRVFAGQQDDQAQIARLQELLSQAQLELAQSQSSKDGMANAMKIFADTMNGVIDQRNSASQLSDALSEEVTDLQGEIEQWEGRQERVISQLEEAARTSMSALEKVFDRSSIDLDRILDETKRDYTGSGGPFEPISNANPQSEAEDDLRVASLITDMERINLMRVAVDLLPFGQPVTGARKTSGFGIRRDPIRRRSAMHTGVDFAAPRGTPIFSTAEGVVTFAGRQSGYGIVVKIRHAFGFETVYAHLNRARVKVGQHVERGDRIADMGSTGRSTGSHLHYEVRIDKEPVNPAKFIEAAHDVL